MDIASVVEYAMNNGHFSDALTLVRKFTIGSLDEKAHQYKSLFAAIAKSDNSEMLEILFKLSNNSSASTIRDLYFSASGDGSQHTCFDLLVSNNRWSLIAMICDKVTTSGSGCVFIKHEVDGLFKTLLDKMRLSVITFSHAEFSKMLDCFPQKKIPLPKKLDHDNVISQSDFDASLLGAILSSSNEHALNMLLDKHPSLLHLMFKHSDKWLVLKNMMTLEFYQFLFEKMISKYVETLPDEKNISKAFLDVARGTLQKYTYSLRNQYHELKLKPGLFTHKEENTRKLLIQKLIGCEILVSKTGNKDGAGQLGSAARALGN